MNSARKSTFTKHSSKNNRDNIISIVSSCPKSKSAPGTRYFFINFGDVTADYGDSNYNKFPEFCK